MQKIGNIAKKLLDADTQALVKAGYINGGLELTTEGRDELSAILFEQNMPALVTAAQAKIAEETKQP